MSGATGSAPPRIFIGGIGHESCTFTPLRTGLGQFGVARGTEWLQAASGARSVAGGILHVLQAAGLQPVPGLSAWAGVSGLVEPPAWAALSGELLQRLADAAGGGIAGVALDLHGSLSVQGLDDAQGTLLQAVRALVGPATPVVCALDLHACVTPRMVAAADAFAGYRTAPHRDHWETGVRVATLLARMLRERRRPSLAQVRVPLLLPGEFAQTDTEPTASLWRMAEGLERHPAVWCVSLLDGFPWADIPYNEASVLVVADAPPEQAEQWARALAGGIWAVRAGFYRSAPALPVDAGLIQARAWAAAGAPVILSDSGDNPTAGAPQDRADIVAALLAADVRDAVVALLVDPPAVAAAAAAGIGAAVDIQLGGTLAPGDSPTLRLRGTVELLRTGTAAGTVAVLRERGVRVVVGERRRGMTDPHFLQELGIDPATPGQILVLKIGYLFPAYADLVRATPGAQTLLLLTPGATSLDPRAFDYHRVTRPIYPLDADAGGMTDAAWGVALHPGGPLAGG